MMNLKPIRVLALDPGITCGYAQGIIKPDEPMIVGNGQVKYDHLRLYAFIKGFTPDVIVCERFEYRNIKSDVVELFSRELIGVVNLYVQVVSGTVSECELVMQHPYEAVGKNAYFGDKKLKELKVHSVANPHANDATRHLLQWYTFGSGFRYNDQAAIAPA